MPINHFLPSNQLKLKQKIRHSEALSQQRVVTPSVEAFTPALDEALEHLGDKILGDVVLPTDPDYAESKEIFNNLYEQQENPKVIVFCENISDVQACLQIAVKCSLAVVVRSGGHSTAGFCLNDGMVIDVSRMNYAVVSGDKKTVTVGAGTNFGSLNRVLDFYDVHLPGGGCPTVRVGGYMQGGGYGLTSRIHGMNCDNVTQVKLVTADGNLVIANNKINQDLYWAIRGGTGNNFGVLVEVEYRLSELYKASPGAHSKIWGFKIFWKGNDVAKAIYALQEVILDNPDFDKFGFEAGASKDEKGEMLMFVMGVFDGPESIGRPLLEINLLAHAPGADLSPQFSLEGSYNEINQKFMSEADDSIGHMAGYAMESLYTAKKLPLHEWEKLIERFADASAPAARFFILECYGGAINQLDSDFNAFMHRDVYFDFAVTAIWATQPEMKPALAWIDGFINAISSLGNGHSYQNYPRRGISNYAEKYWGRNYEKLRRVKTMYDPKNVFEFPQGIQPLKK